jgi:hypothetical protein
MLTSRCVAQPRVWPGLVDGEIVGTWGRAHADVTVESWRRLSCAEREAVGKEASGVPLLCLEWRARSRPRWVS